MTGEVCEACEGRGWNLRNARIEVCDCGTYDDPPKWVKRGDAACVLEHHKDPERPRRASLGYVCAGHQAKLERLIAEIPALYDELGLALTSSERPDSEGHNKGKSTSTGVALNERVLEDRRDIHDYLVSMVRDVLQGIITAASAPCPVCGVEPYKVCAHFGAREELAQKARALSEPVDDVNALATWLLNQLDWICEQPDVDETHDNLDRLTRSAWRLAYPSGRQRVEIGPCGTDDCPGVLWLVGSADEGRTMACDNCKREVEPRYWRRERRRIDGADVNPWILLSEAAVLYGTTTRTIERWAAKGRLKTRGSPMRVKASAVEAIVRTFTNRCA